MRQNFWNFYTDDFWFSVIKIGAPSHGQTIQARNPNFFASCRQGSKLWLGVGLDHVRKPEVTGKPEESQKTVMTVRWCEFFIFLNRPYPDVKRWYYTQNDAVNLMLKSDFDQRNKKMKKNDIFFHSLLFLTLKYKIFSGTSGYRKWSNPLPSHNFNLRLCP